MTIPKAMSKILAMKAAIDSGMDPADFKERFGCTRTSAMRSAKVQNVEIVIPGTGGAFNKKIDDAIPKLGVFKETKANAFKRSSR